MAARRLLRVAALLRAVAFEVIQERGDQRRVELGDVQGGGRLAEAFGGEGQQEPEGPCQLV